MTKNDIKKEQKRKSKPLQSDKINKLRSRIKYVKNLEQAKALLSQVIAMYQKNEVDSEYVKTIGTALHHYATLHKVQRDDSLELRLEALEKLADDNTNN